VKADNKPCQEKAIALQTWKKRYNPTTLHHCGAEKTVNSPNPITVELSERISCRLYSDTRPHCLETAPLQKGLVLTVDGQEVIEEGVGFGAPVVLYRDEPYFSSSAECSVLNDGDHKVLVKSFLMDTVSRKRLGKTVYVNDRFYMLLHKGFHKVYMKNSILTPFFNRLIELTKLFGVNTEFVKVKPRGRVTFTYEFQPDSVAVEVSFEQLDKDDCEEIVVLNEQGASFFRKYSDSNGLTLVDGQIGAWVDVEADEASLSDARETLGFSLRKVQGAVFFRGREKIRKRYSWVGLGYSIRPPFSTLRYSIKLKTRFRR
jgi:hypothetical protein